MMGLMEFEFLARLKEGAARVRVRGQEDGRYPLDAAPVWVGQPLKIPEVRLALAIAMADRRLDRDYVWRHIGAGFRTREGIWWGEFVLDWCPSALESVAVVVTPAGGRIQLLPSEVRTALRKAHEALGCVVVTPAGGEEGFPRKKKR